MKSSSPEAGPLRLTVRAAQREATISVMDHSWRIVARGIGRLTADLPPGIYKIEAQLGGTNWTEHVSLRDGPQSVRVPHIGIKSAVPDGMFTRSRESHKVRMNAARARTDVEVGKGARILMMARNWSPDGTATADLPQLRLERWRGDQLADLLTHGQIDTSGDAVGVCAVETNPGAYVVSAATPFGRVSQSVYALDGWETQVFVLRDFTSQRGGAGGSEERTTISVTQSIVRPGGGDPSLYELLEAGQVALAERQPGLGDEVFEEIANGKWNAPILGLLAAHILLLADDPKWKTQPDAPLVSFDRGQFETILSNTAELLGTSQPDVLALRTRSERMPAPEDVEVTTPPLFVRSWKMLLEASKADRPNLLPGSLWRRVRGNTNSAPYFTWTRADSVFAAQQRASEQRLIEDFAKAAEPVDVGAALDPAAATLDPAELKHGKTSSDALETAGATSEKPDLSSLDVYAPRLDLRRLVTGTGSSQDALKQIARHFDLPYSVAEKLLGHDAIRRLLSRRGK